MAGLQSWVEILPDFSKLDGKVKSHLTSTLGDAGTAGAGSFGSSFKSSVGAIFTGNFLADIAGSAARGIGELIGGGIRTGLDYGLGSIDLASDLNESLNASKVTFGADIAAQLQTLGSTAPQRLALTQKAFAGLTVQFGAFAKSIRGGDVVGFLDELTNRGADFASVYNLEVNDSLALFQSGLAGETEPLRKFGIDLSAAAVEAYAYRTGLAAVGDELTETQKVQARYGSLMEQTAQTQGDNANTADEYAGSLRRLTVKLEEAQTNFGQALLPTAIDVVTFANDELLPILTSALSEAGPALTASITEVLPEIKELIGTAADNLPQAIEASVGVLGLVSDSLEADLSPTGVIGGFPQFVEELQGFATWLTTPIGETWPETTAKGFEHWWDVAWDGVQDNIEIESTETQQYWESSMSNLANEALKNVPGLTGAGTQLGSGFAAGIRGTENQVAAAVKGLSDTAVTTLKSGLQIYSPSRVFMELGSYVGQGFSLGIQGEQASIASSVASLVSVPSVDPSTVQRSDAGAAEGTARGPLVKMDIHAVDGPSATTMGRVVADQLQFALRGP